MTLFRLNYLLLFLVTILLGLPCHNAFGSFIDSETIHIGVLAKSGKENCFDQWYPTADYLEEKIPEYRVQIVCMDFDEADKIVQERRVDFTITDPSMYVNLEYTFGVSRISTLKNKRSRKSFTQFGGVIFYRADREDIKTVEDLKGKKFMAVAENAFGGWQVSYRYLQDRGIDPMKDFDLHFGGSHDKVILAVERGEVDAGAVRTDALERMFWEQKIDVNDFDIIDLQDEEGGFEFLRTTRLYPEWPLAKVKHTSQQLAKRVALAMLQMPETSKAAKFSRSRGWTIPLDYNVVHDCLRQIKAPPYTEYGKITLRQFYLQYKGWIFVTLLFLIFTFCGLALVLTLNRKLKTTLDDLDQEHQQGARMLAELNEFKMTLDQTLDCVFMFSADTLKFIYVNQGALDHVGYNRAELLNMTPLDLSAEGQTADLRAMLTPLLEKKKSSVNFVGNSRRKDGTLVPVEVFMQYVAPPGKEGRFVAIVRDITARLQEEEEKEVLRNRLLQEQKLASVGQLAAGIAHEINTPAQYLGANLEFLGEAFEDVTTLISHYEQLADGVQEEKVLESLFKDVENCFEEVDWPYLKEEIPKAINQSSGGVEQVSSIVLAMKNFAHPSGLAKEMTDLNDLLKTTLTVSRNEWKYVAEPILKLGEDIPLVKCVRNEIGQVFLNIIINGAHSIAEKLGDGEDGVKGQITITTTTEKELVQVTIADTGCGMNEETMGKIFDPFFTTKEVGKGTGQGLTIAYDIITEKHAGVITVTSEEGVGTIFTIQLLHDG